MSYTVIKSVVVRILNNVTDEKLTVSNAEWDATLATCTNGQTAAHKLFQKHMERGSGRIESHIN